MGNPQNLFDIENFVNLANITASPNLCKVDDPAFGMIHPATKVIIEKSHGEVSLMEQDTFYATF